MLYDRFCGSVEHLKNDCPRKIQKDARSEVRVDRNRSGESIEDVSGKWRPREDDLCEMNNVVACDDPCGIQLFFLGQKYSRKRPTNLLSFVADLKSSISAFIWFILPKRAT